MRELIFNYVTLGYLNSLLGTKFNFSKALPAQQCCSSL